MRFWVLNFTKAGTDAKDELLAQAYRVLELGLWGIPSTTPSRTRLAPGDHALALVGDPEMTFVGTATLGSDWIEFTPEEQQQRAALGAMEADPRFSRGFRLKDVRLWRNRSRYSPSGSGPKVPRQIQSRSGLQLSPP